MKKLLGLICMAFVLLVCVTSIAETQSEGDYIYEIKNKSVKIIKYTGEEKGELTIPEKIDNKTVEIIGQSAFEQSSPSVIILPDCIKTIERNAFFGSEVKEIIIPDSKTKITINSQAFSACRKLETIYIPSSATLNGFMFFSQCDSLKSITVSPDNKQYEIYENALVTKKTRELIAYPLHLIGDVFSIPDGIKTIAKKAFAHIHNCKTIIIPDSVEEIGEGAFSYNSLESLEIGTGIKKMGRLAFSNCEYLKHVFIYDGTKVIGDEAFDNCIRLETISIPTSVTKIGRNVFRGNYTVKIITEPKSAAAKYAIKNNLEVVEPSE